MLNTEIQILGLWPSDNTSKLISPLRPVLLSQFNSWRCYMMSSKTIPGIFVPLSCRVPGRWNHCGPARRTEARFTSDLPQIFKQDLPQASESLLVVVLFLTQLEMHGRVAEEIFKQSFTRDPLLCVCLIWYEMAVGKDTRCRDASVVTHLAVPLLFYKLRRDKGKDTTECWEGFFLGGKGWTACLSKGNLLRLGKEGFFSREEEKSSPGGEDRGAPW